MMLNSMLYSLMPWANMMYSFRESDITGKIIVIILFFGSIYAWTVMVTKYLELKIARNDSDRFLRALHKEQNPVAIFLRRQKFAESPSYRVYEKGCAQLSTALTSIGENPDDLFLAEVSSSTQTLTNQQMDIIRNITEQAVADQVMVLERRMGVLATAVSASPFLGLLGTVWGVMGAFTGMAQTGASTLSAVAPGIAAALMTTVVGLLVALPSMMGYNVLTHRIRELQLQMDNFSQEFLSKLQIMFQRNH